MRTNGGVGRLDIDVRFPALELGVSHAAVEQLHPKVAFSEVAQFNLGLAVKPYQVGIIHLDLGARSLTGGHCVAFHDRSVDGRGNPVA